MLVNQAKISSKIAPKFLILNISPRFLGYILCMCFLRAVNNRLAQLIFFFPSPFHKKNVSKTIFLKQKEESVEAK